MEQLTHIQDTLKAGSQNLTLSEGKGFFEAKGFLRQKIGKHETPCLHLVDVQIPQ